MEDNQDEKKRNMREYIQATSKLKQLVGAQRETYLYRGVKYELLSMIQGGCNHEKYMADEENYRMQFTPDQREYLDGYLKSKTGIDRQAAGSCPFLCDKI